MSDTVAHAAMFGRVARFALPAGLVLAGIAPYRELVGAAHASGYGGVLLGLVDHAARPVLAIGYAAALVVAMRGRRFQRGFAGLAAFGRMALTNHVAQSFVYLFVLDGFGFGLISQISATADLALAMLVASAQVAFSVAWLGRHRTPPTSSESQRPRAV